MSRLCQTFLALAACFLGSANVLLLAQTPASPAGIATRILMQEPLGETSEPKMSLFFLNVAAGATIPTHTHAGAVFAYLIQGEIENQVEPDPPQVYQPGGFFHERPMQVHRLLRNVSKTEPAKILIFQNTGSLPASVKPLLQETLTSLANQEVTVMTLTAAPGTAATGAHQHPGPVFAYVLKGEIESQVEPEPPKVYRAGEVFEEPPMHAHRLFRNLSKTEPAELLIFQVGEKVSPARWASRNSTSQTEGEGSENTELVYCHRVIAGRNFPASRCSSARDDALRGDPRTAICFRLGRRLSSG